MVFLIIINIILTHMPYSKTDFPDTMKNLEDITRIKAIDILNAMLKDGYKEENAIPISISQAKKWMKDAKDSEIDKLLNKDITKHKKSSESARLQDSNVRVSFDKDEEMWSVKSVGAKKVSSYHNTKKSAIKEAQKIADNKDSKVIKEKKE